MSTSFSVLLAWKKEVEQSLWTQGKKPHIKDYSPNLGMSVSEVLYEKEISLLHWLSHCILGDALHSNSSANALPENFPLSRLSFVSSIMFSLISSFLYHFIFSYIEGHGGRLVLCWLWDLGLYYLYFFFPSIFILLNSSGNSEHKDFWILGCTEDLLLQTYIVLYYQVYFIHPGKLFYLIQNQTLCD